MTTLQGVRIVVAVTAPSSAGFYAGQLAAIRAAGAEVFFIASPSEMVARQCAEEGVTYLPIAMQRAPAPWQDARALAQVTATLARVRPDIVNAGTPKAGLLGMLASAALRVPARVHTLHGLRYETARGTRRRILWMAQRASCAAATHVVCVSPSLRARAAQTGLLDEAGAIVIGDGTVNGVDLEQFRPGQRAGRPAAAGIVIGYLGRLARDKGIDALGTAWRALTGRGHRLLIAGEDDETDPPDPADLAALRRLPDVTFLGHVADAVGFHAQLDVLVLPSKREGFPTVALEAAAMTVPVITTTATGCVDAVVDGVTGTLIPVGDATALVAAIEQYAADPALRRQHGDAGRARVLERFSRSRVHQLTVEFYRSLLS